jgi:DNA-directed RNA polymerase subunit alpha
MAACRSPGRWRSSLARRLLNVRRTLVAMTTTIFQSEYQQSRPSPAALNHLLNLPIQALDFSTGLERALEEAYVLTVGELVVRSDSELLRWRNIGQARVAEIQRRLSVLGLCLGMGEDRFPGPPVVAFPRVRRAAG